jgi:hypothetical protein
MVVKANGVGVVVACFETCDFVIVVFQILNAGIGVASYMTARMKLIEPLRPEG